MTNLLVLKERIKDFYGKNEVFITPTLKFLLAIISFMLINSQVGFMAKINNIFVVLILALMCSFLPFNCIIIFSAVLILANFYALSAECAIVALFVFLILFLLYFRFTPKDTIVVLLLPLLFILKIPYVIPLVLGLMGTPIAMISTSCGIIVYYLISHVSASENILSSMEAETAIAKFRFVVDGLLGNKAMLVTIIAFAVTIILVYVIRRMSIDHSWTIAMIAGSVTNVIILFVGDLMFDTQISIAATIIGSVFSFFLAKIVQFFTFNLNYQRTERVQFEDDEYYYYVKAVPKITLSIPEKKVKKINPQKRPTMSK